MFRAKWMFELTPGVGSAGLETRPWRASARGPSVKAVDAKEKQELAKEEKVKKNLIFLNNNIPLQ